MTPRIPALLAVLALGGCSSGNDGEKTEKTEKKVETTRVEVVEGQGEGGGLDARGIYERLSPGVVTVISVLPGGGLLGGGDDQSGQGSGFVLDGEGRIATNAHVVTTGRPPRLREAKEIYVQFADGNRVPAKILGADANSDVALLKVDPKGLDLTTLTLGANKDVRVGEPVAALGSPFGEEQSLSVGVVSALDRDIESLTLFSIGDAIQTDAAINPGNSGGPLLDQKGRVIGINAQIRSRSGGGEGVGFAIPVDTVKRSVAELREKGKVDYGFLGVTSQPLYPQLAAKLGIDAEDGAVVVKVEDGSPAEEAGLEAGEDKIDFQGVRGVPKGGDVLVGVDGEKIEGASDLTDLIARKAPGDKIELQVLRGDEKREVTVTLEARPDRPPPAPGDRDGR
ncbi:MAG: trypsin-like peptidase domain-containing protein [Thermoleophilaceae bacterium]|nr:trypsin-like peptidase domain-containing protein [Thermoleophilaceae bacterium]